ncbi:MAG: glycosyltransferase [Candidatus Marinimicrobia bacterium]|nr:glycosyltransferase [Candidatus Neomarinimicrobiota bacterium]
MLACLKKLHSTYDIELLVIRIPPSENAPFEISQIEWINELYDLNHLTAAEIQLTLEKFNPDALFMSGWFEDRYLRAARTMRKRGIPVIAGSDAQWTGSVKQHMAKLISRWYLKSAIDVLWIAGERQRQFAAKLGYKGADVWSGYYACDWDTFSEYYEPNISAGFRHFLYVGRYIERKGLDTLIRAYQIYRDRLSHPWELVCFGAGELEHILNDTDGVVNRGFVQPGKLPEMMSEASAFILPSRKEPWGVVVQEAAATGLPLICSDACGSAVHLLIDGYNGYKFETGDYKHLADCMEQMSANTDYTLTKMRKRSYELSKPYTPEIWARTLHDGVKSIINKSE